MMASVASVEIKNLQHTRKYEISGSQLFFTISRFPETWSQAGKWNISCHFAKNGFGIRVFGGFQRFLVVSCSPPSSTPHAYRSISATHTKARPAVCGM